MAAIQFGGTFKRDLSFLIFGLVGYTSWSIIISAAQDTLSATTLPTTVVLIAQSLPYTLVGFLCPYFIQKVPYWAKTIAVTMAFTCGMLLVSLVNHLYIKLTGIVLMSFGNGLGEITFIPLTAMYDERAVSAYFTGSGVGFFLGPFYYTGMTIFGCVPPWITVLALVGLPLLLPLMYYLLVKADNEEVPMATDYKEIPYSPVGSTKDDENFKLNCIEKHFLIRASLHQYIPLFIGMFCEYLMLQSVSTTISFPSAPFSPRDHYVIYTLMIVIGELIGRSYGLILSCIKPDIKPYTRHTWIFSVILAALLTFMVTASWYRYLSNVGIVLVVMFLAGGLAGALYVTAIANTGEDETSRVRKEFSRAFVQGAAITGSFVAGLLGLFVEPSLRDHCELVTMTTDLCLTRNMNGWNASVSCRGL